MMKQDIVEVYLKDYKRQMDAYEQDIIKRGFTLPGKDSSGNRLTVVHERAERSPVASTAASVAGSLSSEAR